MHDITTIFFIHYTTIFFITIIYNVCANAHTIHRRRLVAQRVQIERFAARYFLDRYANHVSEGARERLLLEGGRV